MSSVLQYSALHSTSVHEYPEYSSRKFYYSGVVTMTGKIRKNSGGGNIETCTQGWHFRFFD